MEYALECEGRIDLGPLPWEISERLAQLSGNWLAYAPEQNSVIVRRGGLPGCPAISGIPCELISIIDAIPLDNRDRIPGGTLHITDENGRVLSVVVHRGELRIQWARPEPAKASENGAIRGWARFAGSTHRAAELRAFAERFGGIYPEGDIPSECEQNLVYVRFRDVVLRPEDLVAKLKELAEPAESLQAELEVVSGTRTPAQSFRITVRDGTVDPGQPADTGAGPA